MCQKQKSINSSSSQAVKRNFNFSMKWLFLLVLKRPCLGLAAEAVVHLVFLSEVSSRLFS